MWVVLNRCKLSYCSLKYRLVKFDGINAFVLVCNLCIKQLAFIDKFLNLTSVIEILDVHCQHESEYDCNDLKVLQNKSF